jgi:hypothetical protein
VAILVREGEAVATATKTETTWLAPHIVKGRVITGSARRVGAVGLPQLGLDELIWPRTEPVPALAVPIGEVIDFLVATGAALASPGNAHVANALEAMASITSVPRPVLAAAYAALAAHFERASLEFQLGQELGGTDVLDTWIPISTPSGKPSRVRAFPARCVHVLAGNAPGVASMTIARAALTKGAHVLKLPSNDLFTAPAILRTMADIDGGHPVARSFSAVYWRGGDEAVEGALMRAQFFDKLVAWGGEASIRSALRYVGPGFELVSFDPKVSISLIGREALSSPERLREVAAAGAADAAIMNGEACSASRFQYVEGDIDQVDRYCAVLAEELAADRPLSAGTVALDADVRAQIETLRDLEPVFGVFGRTDGTGVVVRSDEPVDFHPAGKTVNVIPVRSLADAVRYANVATQTVGVYPGSRKAGLRDALASAGVQRVVTLGSAGGMVLGLPQDGMYPLHRLVRWITDEGDDQ